MTDDKCVIYLNGIKSTQVDMLHDEYAIGYYNGIELALSLLEKRNADFKDTAIVSNRTIEEKLRTRLETNSNFYNLYHKCLVTHLCAIWPDKNKMYMIKKLASEKATEVLNTFIKSGVEDDTKETSQKSDIKT